MAKGRLKKILLGAALTLLTIFLGAALTGYMLIIKDLPDISAIDTYKPSLSTELYTIDNQKFAEFAAEKRILVTFSDIPDYLIKALVSVEDARFYKHNGLDWQGITRAFWENVRARSYVQGASTITQQLARALFLHPQKTLRRKAQEALIALQIEKRYPKEEIITLYLNQVYLGRGAYGVEAASRTYFDKSVSELNLSECVLIAGLPRAPSLYNPYRRPELVESRRQHVLKRMLDEHYITEEQFNESAENPPKFREQVVKYNLAPYFAEYIRRILENNFGSTRLYRDGLQVYTTLDLKSQRTARESLIAGLEETDKRQGFRPIEQTNDLPLRFSRIKEGAPLEKGQKILATISGIQEDRIQVQAADKQGWIKPRQMAWAKIKKLDERFTIGDKVLVRVIEIPEENELDYQFALDQYPRVQGAIVSLDPHTGYIKALVGGYDFTTSKFNRAVQAKRQPGSAFKPFIYAAALSKGFTPADILLDTAIIYQDKGKEKEWKPVNYHEKFVGRTTLRDALEHSRNVVTIKLLQEIGVKPAIKTAHTLGIKSTLAADLSLALGSSSLSLLELTSAYGVFAAGGLKAPPLAIRYITDSDGNYAADNKGKIWGENAPEGKQALDARVSYLMAKMLQGVVEHGTGKRAKSIGRPLAGKTGTTNNYIDAWFIGFSPNIATGVWVGMDEPRPIGRMETGAKAALPVWVNFMKQSLHNTPLEDFRAPEGIVEVSIDSDSGMLATNECDNIIKEFFLAENAPSQRCNKHQPTIQKFLQADLAGELDIDAESPPNGIKVGLDNYIFD